MLRTSPTQGGRRGLSLPRSPPTVKQISRMTSMDRTESTVRNLLTAIEAPLYDVGVLSERGMLPGLDGISAAAVLDRLSLLKYRNAHGLKVSIRPSGEFYHARPSQRDLASQALGRRLQPLCCFRDP